MRIDSNIDPFLVGQSQSLVEALIKIDENAWGVVFVVDDENRVLGSLSDGDVRRSIISSESRDPVTSLKNLCNANFCSVANTANRGEIEKWFGNGVNVIPVVDVSGHFFAVALNENQSLNIGGKQISDQSNTFIIAEIGNNHNGDLELAKQLVDHAIASGADCVKFQIRDMEETYRFAGALDHSADLGAQYTLDILRKFQLSLDCFSELFDYCSGKIIAMCTPWDVKSVDFLETVNVPGYKVASADMTNHLLIKRIVATKKPLIISTGMSTDDEISLTTNLLQKMGAQYALLHCNSTYPTPFKDINLGYLKTLAQFADIIGYSGHERGWSVPIAAVALGAKIIEKHLTVDRSMEGSDHKASLLPSEFNKMVSDIRNVEISLRGDPSKRSLTQGEMINRENLAKSIVAKKPLTMGDKITRDCLEIRSPGQGLQPIYIDSLVGRTARHNFEVGDFFYHNDLKVGDRIKRTFSFSRPFGIPVRYHDYEKLTAPSNVDFVEFHLSYQDLNVELETVLEVDSQNGFSVHCPELFADDHLLDLASNDIEYRNQSTQNLNRVCEITRQIGKYFPRENLPIIVVNVGGFKLHGFFDEAERKRAYRIVQESLEKIDCSGVRIAIQTMPPFPWHFGGQSHHNLFVRPDEIVEFCERTGFGICLDVSHSMMACNYYGWDLDDFVRQVSKHNIYLHIVDAIGIDGEGIEVGNGDVDFKQLLATLDEVNPDVRFIPEVWQGHKDDGHGFWQALEFLENLSR